MGKRSSTKKATPPPRTKQQITPERARFLDANRHRELTAADLIMPPPAPPPTKQEIEESKKAAAALLSASQRAAAEGWRTRKLFLRITDEQTIQGNHRSRAPVASISTLKLATQEEALRRWNSDSSRPHWDREGRLAERLYPGPLDVTQLGYLSAAGLVSVRSAAARQKENREADRAATKLLEQMASAAAEAEALLAKYAQIDHPSGVGFRTLRYIASALPAISEWRGARLFRSELRADLALDVRSILERQGCAAPPAVLALASILCGEFPNLAAGEEWSAKLVIEEERKLLAKILGGRKKTRAARAKNA